MTDIIKQIDKLSIPVGEKSLLLFENTPSGVLVLTDEKLIDGIKIAAKNCDNVDETKEKAIERARLYTRAIGRIMLHALANKQTLPTNSMPPFLINCESNIGFWTVPHVSHIH